MHKFETRKHVENVLPCLVLEMKSWKLNGPKATFKKSYGKVEWVLVHDHFVAKFYCIIFKAIKKIASVCNTGI